MNTDIRDRIEECYLIADEIEKNGVMKDEITTTLRENVRYEVLKFLSFLSSISKPIGFTICSLAPVAAQVRAMLPQFCGISGSTSTILSIAITSNLPSALATLLYVKSAIKSIKKCGFINFSEKRRKNATRFSKFVKIAA